MPRIDIDDLSEFDLLIEAGVDVNSYVKNDCPIDICARCAHEYGFESAVAHPQYGEFEDDLCAICGVSLSWFDA